MKFFIAPLFYILSFGLGHAQGLVLRVLGHSSYVEHAESHVLLFSINRASVEKIKNLKDAIAASGLKNDVIVVDSLMNSKIVRYRIEEEDADQFDKLLVICGDLQVSIDKIYFKMPEHVFEDEDKKAVLALRNANLQAKIIASHLGYKDYKIVNIDDETSYSSSMYDVIDLETEKGELLLKLFELLVGSNSLYATESENPSRNGSYGLWVTYELKKK